MKRHALYIVTLTNKKYQKPNDGLILVKFGTTHHIDDIMKRFDPAVDDGYVKKYDDWIITPGYDQEYQNYDKAHKVEQYILHKIFPPKTHKRWMEDYLKCESRNEYYDNTGITEFRLLTKQELYIIISKLEATKSKEQREAKYAKRQQYVNY